jgi:hypothetical protein
MHDQDRVERQETMIGRHAVSRLRLLPARKSPASSANGPSGVLR